MSSRLAGLSVGLVFGVLEAWSGMTSPNVIRQALLLERSYLYLFLASAVLVAAAGVALLRRINARALLMGAPVSWTQERPARRHVVGSVLFGLGWGLADACPGPIVNQLGQGIGWALFTCAGALVGVYVFLRRNDTETEPATEPQPVAAGTGSAPARAA